MPNQYGESSPSGEQNWGRGGWPQSGEQSGQQQPGPQQPGGAQPQGGYNQGGYQPQGNYGQPGGYGQPSGYQQQPGYPQQNYGQPNQPNQPYGQPPAGYQPGPAMTSGYGYGAPPYASWITRVGAYLVDALPSWVLVIIGFTLLAHGGAGAVIGSIFYLASFGWVIYNRWYRAGTTGQSLGKSATNVRLISEQTGRPIGGGMAFVRDLCHFVDAVICYVGFLFPLWDDKRQTLADKIMSTVVVKNGGVPPAGPQGYQPPGNGWQ